MQTGTFLIEDVSSPEPDATAWYEQGLALYEQGAYQEAIAAFSQAIELGFDPLNWAYYYRADAHLKLGESDQAIADYDLTLLHTPNPGPEDAVTYVNRGVAYVKLGDFEQAIADFTQALTLRPDYDLAFLNRGLAYIQQGDTERAIADFRQVLEISTDPALRQTAEEQLRALGVEP